MRRAKSGTGRGSGSIWRKSDDDWLGMDNRPFDCGCSLAAHHSCLEHAMKAEDILPDRQDRIRLGGVEIRKGSVGAFIANARLLLEEELPAAQRRQAEEDLRALLPAIRALGLLELFELRDARLRTLVADWENAAGRS
ncbi:hypothetical protein P38_3517 [Pseudomonas aeruginosa MH38]|nr:hypothetical protein P38_3517 [Pseudomonas aeruginosa MH38]